MSEIKVEARSADECACCYLTKTALQWSFKASASQVANCLRQFCIKISFCIVVYTREGALIKVLCQLDVLTTMRLTRIYSTTSIARLKT